MARLLTIVCSLVVFGISACINTVETEPLDGDEASPVSEASGVATAIVPTPEPTPTTNPERQLSFESQLFRDNIAGFELDYPSSWSEGYGEQQSRGYFQTYFSWDPAVSDSIEFVPEGGTYMQIVVYIWEPTNDLDAFVAWQSQSLEGSGNELLSKEEITLSDGESGVMVLRRSADGSKEFFSFWMAIGERYLSITGEGDLALLTEIVYSVRVFGG